MRDSDTGFDGGERVKMGLLRTHFYATVGRMFECGYQIRGSGASHASGECGVEIWNLESYWALVMCNCDFVAAKKFVRKKVKNWQQMSEAR